MKRKIGILLLVIFVLMNSVYATEMEENSSGENAFLEDVYAYSGEVQNEEELKGELKEIVKTEKGKNIMLLGKELNLTGEAKDLIMAAGESITSKALGSYAFMAARQLDISGEIFKDTFVLGNEINVEGDIRRDLYALGNKISISGQIERDVYAGAEELNITGTIEGDVQFIGDTVFISSNAVINGDVSITASTIEIRDGATIHGIVTYQNDAEMVEIPESVETKIKIKNPVAQTTVQDNITQTIKDYCFWTISNFVLFLVIHGIWVHLFEKIDVVYEKDAVQKCCSSCGWGLLWLVILPFISFIALFTIIGSAVGIVGILVYMLVYCIATVLSGYLVGNLVLEKNKKHWVKGFVGIAILEILRRLPVIGWIISILAIAMAFGTMIKLIKSSSKEEIEKIEE